jgi:hypothetical protein
MPPIARAFVRGSFAYFLAAFLLGALMMLDRWLAFSRWLSVLYMSQLHLLVVGWITQLAIGVAYWILPRFLKEDDSRPRGSDAIAWSVLISLNAGLLLRFAVEPFYFMEQQSWLAAMLALAGILQALAALGFAWIIWGRIRPMER